MEGRHFITYIHKHRPEITLAELVSASPTEKEIAFPDKFLSRLDGHATDVLIQTVLLRAMRAGFPQSEESIVRFVAFRRYVMGSLGVGKPERILSDYVMGRRRRADHGICSVLVFECPRSASEVFGYTMQRLRKSFGDDVKACGLHFDGEVAVFLDNSGSQATALVLSDLSLLEYTYPVKRDSRAGQIAGPIRRLLQANPVSPVPATRLRRTR